MWQPLSKSHRLLLGEGPGNTGPCRVRYLDLHARVVKKCPVFPVLPILYAGISVQAVYPRGRSCQAVFKNNRLTSLPHESLLRKELLWSMPHFRILTNQVKIKPQILGRNLREQGSSIIFNIRHTFQSAPCH